VPVLAQATGAAPFGFKGADFDLTAGVEETKRNALRRFYGSGDLHFVTFSCYQRRPYLGTVRARDCFLRILDEVRSRHGFALLGYVLMPEHVHLLIGEPEIGNPSKVLQVVKQKVSQSLCQMESTLASGSAAPAFWQRRFYDFNVWSEKKVKEKLHYMHRNPVDRKLVQHPQDWPWSSWSFYAKGEQGLIRIGELTPKARVVQKPHP
jgi:putative transposase